MWPFDRSSEEILRVGAQSIERWNGPPANLTRRGSVTMAPAPGTDPTVEEVGEALRRLFGERPEPAVTVVLESAWMPSLLVDLGAGLLRPPQVLALLRHRLGVLYGAATADSWDVRTGHATGERFALGHGLPEHRRRLLAGATDAAGIRCRQWLPALAWGLAHCRPSRRADLRRGWFAWPEQDRVLLARFEASRMVGLNASLSPIDDDIGLAHQVAIEAFRLGVLTNDPVVAARAWCQAGPADRAISSGAPGRVPAASATLQP